LTVAAAGCDLPLPVAPPPRPAAAPPAGGFAARPKRVLDDQGGAWGSVVAVGPDWVEVAAGWQGETVRQRKQDHTKPWRIPAAWTTVGGCADGDGESETHRLCDLRVGDRVAVTVNFDQGGQEWAHELIIYRRPGGKIPFPPADWISLRYLAERNQAEQDWEEQRIPIPKKYLDKNGHYDGTNPPYPLRELAPMPRPVATRPSK
jgi:hypothetical protein